MLYLTGDLHGGFNMQKLADLERAGEGAPVPGAGDVLVVCGDFGFPWDFSEAESEDVRWLESRPYRVTFVDGNHERFDHWAERPSEPWHGGRVQRIAPRSPILRLMRGEVYELEGSTLFAMGGATSVDRAWRTEGCDWWPVELPDEEDFERARAALDEVGWQVDYVVTHTCANRMLPRALYPASMWQAPDFDRLTLFLDELEERLEYRHWYCGHFHVDRDLDDRHTALYDRVVPAGGCLAS